MLFHFSLLFIISLVGQTIRSNMLFEALITIFTGAVQVMFLLVPNIPFPSELANSVSFLWEHMYKWNYVFPVDTAVTIFILTLQVYLALWMLKGAMWVVMMIRGN